MKNTKNKLPEMNKRTYDTVIKTIKENRDIESRVQKMKKIKSGTVIYSYAIGRVGRCQYYPRLALHRIQISASKGVAFGGKAWLFIKPITGGKQCA